MLNQYAIIKAIETIAARPNKAFSTRELAKAAGLSPAMASIALGYMEKTGIATLDRIGRTHQYRTNLESPLARQWKILFTTSKMEESGLVKNIVGKIPDLQCILIYGSTARGTDDEKSDLDLLIIAHNPPKSISLGLMGRFPNEINALIYSPAEWKKKASQNKVFYENVIYESIVLYGHRPVIT